MNLKTLLTTSLIAVFSFSCEKDEPGSLLLETSPVTNITATSGITGGNITLGNNSKIAERGICWSTNSLPTIMSNKVAEGSGQGSFIINLTNLLPATTYYVRAYATNGSLTLYGNEEIFKTDGKIRQVETSPITTITANSSITGGIILGDNNSKIVARGVCWSAEQNPVITNNKTADGQGPGSFTSNLTQLLPATKYYVRAYASTSEETVYGDERSFTTANPLTSIVVSPADKTIKAGQTQQYMAAGHYADKSIKDLTNIVSWTSSDGSTANVSSASGQKGLVTSYKPGNVTISASAENMSGTGLLHVEHDPCSTANTPFHGFYSSLAAETGHLEDVTMDTQTHEFTFSLNKAGTICAVGYQGISSSISYLIELVDSDNIVLYTGNHTFSSTSTQYISISPVAIAAGKSYTLRRTVLDYKGNIGNTIGRLVMRNGFQELSFPKTVGSLTISNSNAYGTGGPIENKILPYIDFVFNAL